MKNYFVVAVYADYDERMTFESGGVVNSDNYYDAMKLLKIRYEEVKNRIVNANVVIGVINLYEEIDEPYESDELLYSNLVNLKDGHSIRM